MIISLLLLIYDFSEAEIAKVSLLGTEFVAGKPWVLVATAWAIWAYFLVRYFQYFKSEEEKTVRSAFIDSRRTTVEKFASNRYQKLNPHADKMPDFIIDFKDKKAQSATWRIDVHQRGALANKKEYEWYVSNPRAAWMTTLACLKTTFISTAFTDRIVPFFLAAAALGVSGLPLFWKIIGFFGVEHHEVTALSLWAFCGHALSIDEH